MEPKGQVVGTPIYKQWVKSIGNKLDLWFVAAVGAGSLGKTEPLPMGSKAISRSIVSKLS